METTTQEASAFIPWKLRLERLARNRQGGEG
jgi:hypothetical protein